MAPNASIYLALTDGTQTVAVDASTNKATMTAYVGAAPKEAYEYKYDATATPKYSTLCYFIMLDYIFNHC